MPGKEEKSPLQAAFAKNLKFLNHESYPEDFFRGFFDGRLTTVAAGAVDFPTGRVVLADPLCYLGTKYETRLDRVIPAGSYDVELAILRSPVAGIRVAAARLAISEAPVVSREIAMPEGRKLEELGQPGVWTFFGVDAGLACFADARTAEEYREFAARWREKNPEGDIYNDYFARLFAESAAARPDVQNGYGDFIAWRVPGGSRLTMFSSGLGDGIYSAYWGLDAGGSPAELVIPFMNPEFF
ncbi:DUF4241 domain-containing protein [Cloacibacillus sp. An23]|uniref:DUF4241 domain-containing protein n=1 Tax=Cloacibacillus sp. An23 TaxID=1965591 RepID=UPI001302B9CC|nr:DUF4241 domain-containing protein [Cloacibacillus sp. An23]